MFTPGRLQNLALAAVLLSSGASFAQRYQGRDHTVFHRPAPPPMKHASSAATATNTSNPHGIETARHHDVTFASPPSSHPAQSPAQLSPRPK